MDEKKRKRVARARPSAEDTEVGTVEREFRRQYLVPRLEGTVRSILALEGVQQQAAAKRAGISRVWWTKIICARQITQRDLDTIALGCGLSRERLISECRKVERRSGKLAALA